MVGRGGLRLEFSHCDSPFFRHFRPFYVAITGAEAAPPLFQSMEILGSDLVRVRLRRAIDALGGLSARKLGELERTYEALFSPRD